MPLPDLLSQACTIVGMDDVAVDTALELLSAASIRTPETLEAIWDQIDWALDFPSFPTGVRLALSRWFATRKQRNVAHEAPDEAPVAAEKSGGLQLRQRQRHLQQAPAGVENAAAWFKGMNPASSSGRPPTRISRAAGPAC